MNAITQASSSPGSSGGTSPSETRMYLTFRLGSDPYAVSIERVREIIEFQTLTSVPLLPAFLRGVINLRGSVIPVVDLKARFQRGTTEIHHRTCIVVVESDHRDGPVPLGILVDAVDEVASVNASQAKNSPDFGSEIRPDFVESLLDLGKGFVPALDLRHVLDIQELSEQISDQGVGGSNETTNAGELA